MKSVKYSILLASLFCIVAHAKNNNELIIVNHFNQPLNFKIGVNHEVLPDLPVTFKLQMNDRITSRVMDIQKETYIRTFADAEKSGFWGVDVENNKTQIYGYLSKGIAYSWETQTIVFCTPEEFEQKGSCL